VDLGVQPGDRVAFMASNRIEHVLADSATMHAGAIGMSVYNTLSPSQVAYVADHARPALGVVETVDHLARWADALAAGSVGNLVTIDAPASGGALTWAELVDRGRRTRAQHQDELD